MSEHAIPADFEQLVERALGARPRSRERVRGGANNVCVRVEAGAQSVLAKLYFSHSGDRRDRLGAEFGMLSFLWENGVRCIPQPLARIPERRVGFYEFVEGVVPRAGEIREADTRRLADYLFAMHELRDRPAAEAMPPAADAAFRFRDYLDCIGGRFDRLVAAARDASAWKPFSDFAINEMQPAYRELLAFVEREAAARDIDLDAPFPRAERTLNPADHGFHNALRRGGELVFLDLEYAGRDDAGQMICNACLQPQVPMPDELQEPFVRGLLERMRASAGLRRRMGMSYPVQGYKWALIMLNEFLPVADERRRFAGADPEARRAEQLAKARRRLGLVRDYLHKGGFFAEL